jgi:hypothetical protein
LGGGRGGMGLLGGCDAGVVSARWGGGKVNGAWC